MDKNLQLTKNFVWGEFWSNNFDKEKKEPPEEYFYKILREAISFGFKSEISPV